MVVAEVISPIYLVLASSNLPDLAFPWNSCGSFFRKFAFEISNANGRFGQFNLELDWSDALIGDPDCIPQNVGAPFTRLDCDFSKDSIQGLVADPTVYF